jgi:intracellular sulfur oxidation DsrE/DsrF family protein
MFTFRKKSIMRYCLILIFVLTKTIVLAQRTFPEISDFGGVYPIPEAEILVNPDQKYKIVCDLKQASNDQAKEINSGYESVARLINLYGLSGVKKENLDIVVVIHFEASPTILSDNSFQFLYKNPNPNTKIINKLAENGVRFYICGQSLRVRKLVDLEKNKNIKVAHGALLALAHFQSLNYTLIKF